MQYFFLTWLGSLDESQRTGAEFSDASRGGYEVERVSLAGDDLVAIDLRPAELKQFILANRSALLAEADEVSGPAERSAVPGR